MIEIAIHVRNKKMDGGLSNYHGRNDYTELCCP